MIYTHATAGILPAGRPFELAGIAYPGNWLANATAEDLAAAGIVSAPDPIPEPVPVDLALLKSSAKATIGMLAEEARMRYLTPGAGKAMSYQAVASEAKLYQATGGIGNYPFLQARVDSGRYADLAAAAAGTLAIENAWAEIGAIIDRVEDAAKLAVDRATKAAQVEAAMAVVWP